MTEPEAMQRGEFVVRRTSAWGDAKPCDEAREALRTRVDYRTFTNDKAARKGEVSGD